jgi:hypothetical protein
MASLFKLASMLPACNCAPGWMVRLAFVTVFGSAIKVPKPLWCRHTGRPSLRGRVFSPPYDKACQSYGVAGWSASLARPLSRPTIEHRPSGTVCRGQPRPRTSGRVVTTTSVHWAVPLSKGLKGPRPVGLTLLGDDRIRAGLELTSCWGVRLRPTSSRPKVLGRETRQRMAFPTLH